MSNDKLQKQINKLVEIAKKLEDEATDKLNQNRLSNTARRAEFARRAEEEAAKQLTIARTMIAVAEGLEAGSIEYLDKLKTKKDFEALEIALCRCKWDAARELNEGYGKTNDREVEYGDIKYTLFTDQLSISDNLIKLGIINDYTLRSALKEYFLLREKGLAKPDPVKELERSLIGHSIPGFFPTPDKIIFQMLSAANLADGMRILEPSAGNGRICDLIKSEMDWCKKSYTLDVCEVNRTLQEILKAKGYNLVDNNFLSYHPHWLKYDRILMNPPFEKGQDREHIYHAYDLLNQGGRLIAIACENSFFANNQSTIKFRDWLDKVNADVTSLPEGAFKESGTMVRARIVVINKAYKLLTE